MSSLVSIVMPCYNKAQTLEGSIDSVLKQTYPHIELLLIDDGSTDETHHILQNLVQRYTAKPCRTIFPQIRVFTTSNRGQAAALNLGLSQAAGEYVGFIDADDEYYPHHVEALVYACQEEKLDVAFAGLEIIVCGDQTHFVDYFDRSKLIPIAEVDCVTGMIFGRHSVLNELQFRGDFLDIDLYTRVTNSSLKWAKLEQKTYRYFFGRCQNSNSARMVTEAILRDGDGKCAPQYAR